MSTLAEEHPELDDAVDVLVRRYGAEGAERRLLAALSLVRQRKIEQARGGGE